MLPPTTESWNPHVCEILGLSLCHRWVFFVNYFQVTLPLFPRLLGDDGANVNMVCLPRKSRPWGGFHLSVVS